MILTRSTIPVLLLAALSLPAAAPAPAKSDLQQQLDATQKELDKYPTAYYLDPKFHSFFEDKIPPLLQKKLTLLQQVAPATYAASLTYAVDLVLLAQFNPDAEATLHTLASSPKPADARNGRTGEALAAIWKDPASSDAAKSLDALEADALKTPADPYCTGLFFTLLNTTDDDALYTRLDNFILAKLRSPEAIKYRARPNKLLHPLRLYGTTVDNKSFTLDKYKGKVVLIDFWATWCPPCREELPHLAELYKKYHADGLEIVGVSNDSDRRDLLAFLKEHPEMPWPQLYGPTPPSGWNAITENFGIHSIPRTYLVDKAGTLRAMRSLSALEKQIPTLLAESPTTQPTAKP